MQMIGSTTELSNQELDFLSQAPVQNNQQAHHKSTTAPESHLQKGR